MEQHKSAAKPISKILKLLPGATSSVSFQSPTLYSPVKDKRASEKPHKSNLGIGLSGPMVTMIQSDNRRRIKNDSNNALISYEPTSPTVSCMGTVKCKQYYRKKLAGATNKPPPRVLSQPTNRFSRTASFNPVRIYKTEEDQEKVEKVDQAVVDCKKQSVIRSLLRGGSSRSGRKSDATTDKSTTTLNLQKAPGLSTMKRFSSGRDAFTNFDWKSTQVTPLDSDQRNYFTDDDRDCGSDGEGDEYVMVPSSVPEMVRNKGVCDNFVRVGGVKLEPQKEINLWKRRTMAQPQPLQLHAA